MITTRPTEHTTERGRDRHLDRHLDADLDPDRDPERRMDLGPKPDRVLVVDDNDDIRALISTILTRAGYNPEAADGGIAALAAATRATPEMYVLDLDMPGINGLDLCRDLKANHRTHAPVLIVSANTTADAITAAHAAGADAYLPKPFTRHDLLNLVNTLLQTTAAA